jgi:hypothetical protein
VIPPYPTYEDRDPNYNEDLNDTDEWGHDTRFFLPSTCCCRTPRYLGFNTTPGARPYLIECILCRKFFILDTVMDPVVGPVGNGTREYVCLPAPLGESDYGGHSSQVGLVKGHPSGAILANSTWIWEALAMPTFKMFTFQGGVRPGFLDHHGHFPWLWQDMEFIRWWLRAKAVATLDTVFLTHGVTEWVHGQGFTPPVSPAMRAMFESGVQSHHMA